MKYIIDVPEDKMNTNDICTIQKLTNISMTLYEEYDTAEDAWNFVGRLIGYSDDALTVDEFCDCYGTNDPCYILDQLSYEEAKEQYDKWKNKKDEIHVGDELAHNDDEEETVIVTRVLKESEAFDGFGKNGEVLKGYFYRFWHKTGRHFEKAVELLKEMAESE